MKKIFLTAALIILSTVSTTILAQSSFLGDWESDGTVYDMIIVDREGDLVLFNYSYEEGGVDKTQEDIIEFSNKEIKTVIYRKENNHFVKVFYELIEKNKIKATFTGDWNGIIYFKKKQ